VTEPATQSFKLRADGNLRWHRVSQPLLNCAPIQAAIASAPAFSVGAALPTLMADPEGNVYVCPCGEELKKYRRASSKPRSYALACSGSILA